MNLAVFKLLWQEVGRRGLNGMGTAQKTLAQIHQARALTENVPLSVQCDCLSDPDASAETGASDDSAT